MKQKELHRIYFLGIGGIGMSALARYFLGLGKEVYGYDRTSTPLTQQLEKEGAIIHYQEDVNAIPPEIDLVIFTPAIPVSNVELLFLKQSNIKLLKRSEALGELTKDHFTIAVAGTHGKTTITSIIAHILKTNQSNITAFIGGISKNYSSNIIISDDPAIFVVEADEYDRSFLALSPDIAVVSSVDADHLDIYNNKKNLEDSFITFAHKIKKDGYLICSERVNIFDNKDLKVLKYSLNNENEEYYTSGLSIDPPGYRFDLNLAGEVLKNVKFNIPGKHNIENSVAASTAAKLMEVKAEVITKALSTYSGVERRFDIRIMSTDIVYIDDYAHHPEEIKALIDSVRELFPGKRTSAIFQPHLFSRTAYFAEAFAECLSLFDEIILLDIYPAREKPIEGITSQMLLTKINNNNKIVLSKNELLKKIDKTDYEIILTIGAGDIDQLVNPIEMKLRDKYNIKAS